MTIWTDFFYSLARQLPACGWPTAFIVCGYTLRPIGIAPAERSSLVHHNDNHG